MCGIAGFISQRDGVEHLQTLRRMVDQLSHRGPDARGEWADTGKGVFLGHRRLSILDLSESGAQPMTMNGLTLVYNGEAYNYVELAKELSHLGHRFRGGSDTEVILAGICEWGLEDTLKKLVGMFALGLWDENKKTLSLARDRMGEKPLYFGWSRGDFLFSSELKAFQKFSNWNPEIDRGAVSLFMRHNYIPCPWSIYQGIYKLMPGTSLTLTWNERDRLAICQEGFSPFPGAQENSRMCYEPFWSLHEVVKNRTILLEDVDPGDRLEELLCDSISLQLRSDVPVGAFLSGGVDSSTIVALMQKMSDRPIKTFTIGFNEAAFNEATYAKGVATHLKTDHTELYVDSKMSRDVVPKLAQIYDEPFSDSSQIPTFLVSQLAREHVTVSLSGDAGDELFGGYNRYLFTNRAWNKISGIPRSMRIALKKSICAFGSEFWDGGFSAIRWALPRRYQFSNFGDKLLKASAFLEYSDRREVYRSLVSHWKNPESLVTGGFEPTTLLTKDWNLKDFSFIEEMMFLDSLTYLPDDILVKVDRASMAVSLESRIPLLDHRIVEFAWSLPQNMKLRNGVGKWPLRQILYKYVPRELIERPKVGFGVPLGDWLRGPLRQWAESLLSPNEISEHGLLDSSLVSQAWADHLSGKRNCQYQIWDVLMFQQWYKDFHKQGMV